MQLKLAISWETRQACPNVKEVRTRLGNGISTGKSVVTAIYAVCRFLSEPFDQLLDFVRQLGGDVDTIGAMAGAFWGARNGAAALPDALIEKLEDAPRIKELARRLFDARWASS